METEDGRGTPERNKFNYAPAMVSEALGSCFVSDVYDETRLGHRWSASIKVFPEQICYFKHLGGNITSALIILFWQVH